MAQFSLSLVNNRGRTVLTDYDVVHGKTAGLTFDERLNLNVDGSTLDFSMLKYLYEGANKVVNTPAVSITYGSIIQCLHNGHRYDFAVTDISYQFLAENLQLSFAAQDYFQFETSKLGIGYTITGDTTDPTYFGAQPIDAWAQKIVHDNNLRWGYVPINQANREWINLSLSNTQKELTFDTSRSPDDYWQTTNAEYTLNQWVSFECSDSSAYGALKQLATDNGLMIVVDYSSHNFWFAPKKNIIFNGYFFNPKNNLQQFSIRGSAQNLVTVLDVSGPKDLQNQEITLIPSFPASVMSWIMSPDWDKSIYYPGLYQAYTDNMETDFTREVAYTPWLENKLIDFTFFTDNGLLLPSEAQDIQNILYNKLRIINGKIIVQRQRLLTDYGTQLADINQLIINSEALFAGFNSDVDIIYNLLFNNDNDAICYAVQDPMDGKPWIYWPSQRYGLQASFDGQNWDEVADYNLGDGGVFNGWLESPEVEMHEKWIDIYPTNVSQLNTLLTVKSNNKISAYQFCIQPGASLQFFGQDGGFASVNGWQLPNVYSNGNARQAEFVLSEAVGSCCFKLSFTAADQYIFQIEYDGGGITATYWNGRNWENDIILNNEWQYVGPCMLRKNDSNHSIIWSAPGTEQPQDEVQHYLNRVDFVVMSFNGDNGENMILWPYGGSNPLHTIIDYRDQRLALTDWLDSSNPQLTNFKLKVNGNEVELGDDTILLDSTFEPVNINIQYKTSVVAVADIKHVKMLKGPMYFQAFTSGSETNSLFITVDENGNFTSPLLLDSLRNASIFTTSPSNTDPLIILPNMLNQLCSTRNSFEQSLGQYIYDFYTLWQKELVAAQESNGQITTPAWTAGHCVIKYQSLALLPDTNTDILRVDDPFSTTDPTLITSDDIARLQEAMQVSASTPLQRSAVITFIHTLSTQLTEKWNNCYNIASVLGIYWPRYWDESKWLLDSGGYHDDLIADQRSLFYQLSPLIVPGQWPRIENTVVTDLTLNTTFFPVLHSSTTEVRNSTFQSTQIYQSPGGPLKGRYNLSITVKVEDTSDPDETKYKSYTSETCCFFNIAPGEQYVISDRFRGARFTYTLDYNSSDNTLSLSCTEASGAEAVSLTISIDCLDQLRPITELQTSWQFADKKEVEYTNTPCAMDNTELRPELSTRNIPNIYSIVQQQHTAVDNLQLYRICHNVQSTHSQVVMSGATTPAQILSAPIPSTNMYSADHADANPPIYPILFLAQSTLTDTSLYYNCLKEHDLIWQDLYARFPGIFRESSYVNETATNSQELYVAAKAQLDNLSRPSYEYTLTGMDIYMYNSDYTPTKLQLGDQIRIDYQDPDQITDTLNAAIREPLYVTGISHTLRNDGDYQFTVTTRNATDSMVQRFAQLLSFGR